MGGVYGGLMQEFSKMGRSQLVRGTEVPEKLKQNVKLVREIFRHFKGRKFRT